MVNDNVQTKVADEVDSTLGFSLIQKEERPVKYPVEKSIRAEQCMIIGKINEFYSCSSYSYGFSFSEMNGNSFGAILIHCSGGVENQTILKSEITCVVVKMGCSSQVKLICREPRGTRNFPKCNG